MKAAIDLDVVERHARGGALPALIDELAASADAAIRLLARALRLDLTVLSAHPELAYPCLHRRGYWSGAEATAFLAGVPAGGASPLRPLLDAWRPRGRGPWLRALRPLRVSLDGALREEYRGDLSGGAPVLSADAIGARGPDGVVAWDRRSGARLSQAEIASRLPDEAPARFALKRGGGWGRCDLVDAATGHTRKVRVDRDASFDCAVDVPGGHAIAAGWFCDYNGVIVRLDPAAASVVWRTDVVHSIQSLAISADGALLLAGDGTCHHLLDAGTGKVLGRLDVSGAVGFSPDGSEIALRRGDALQTWDLDGIRRGDHLASVPHGLVDAADRAGLDRRSRPAARAS